METQYKETLEGVKKNWHDYFTPQAVTDIYNAGRNDVLKDLPRWKKFAPNINDPLSEQQICAELENSVMCVDDGGYCWIISRKELNKLPKEDSHE